MGKIVALIFCLMLGALLYNQRLSALFWFPAGFASSLFISSQVILPIMLGLPKAIKFIARGQMRPAVLGFIILTPAICLVALGALGFFWPLAIEYLNGVPSFGLGGWLGFIAIVLTPLSRKGRADFQKDFEASYGRFYFDMDHHDAKPAYAEAIQKGSSNSYGLERAESGQAGKNASTMTMAEAERILDIVSEALQDTRHRHHPISALKGYDIYRVCTALKLRIANEFLQLADRDDFHEQFADGLKLYDSIPWSIMRFVPDDQADSINPDFVFIDPSTMTFKDERFASDETGSSFGDYCKGVGSKDPAYWQKIYARIGLQHTSQSPKGNDPVTPGDPAPIVRWTFLHEWESYLSDLPRLHMGERHDSTNGEGRTIRPERVEAPQPQARPTQKEDDRVLVSRAQFEAVWEPAPESEPSPAESPEPLEAGKGEPKCAN